MAHVLFHVILHSWDRVSKVRASDAFSFDGVAQSGIQEACWPLGSQEGRKVQDFRA